MGLSRSPTSHNPYKPPGYGKGLPEKTEGFQSPEIKYTAVVRYWRVAHPGDDARKQIEDHITKEYQCTSRPKGTDEEREKGSIVITEEEINVGILVFDCKDQAQAFKMEQELHHTKTTVLDKYRLNVYAGKGEPWHFDMCVQQGKTITGRYRWFVHGRRENNTAVKEEFPFPAADF